MSQDLYTINPVLNGLYISGYKALSKQSIQYLEITYIVNCTANLQNKPKLPGIIFLRIAIDDYPHVNVMPFLEPAADRVQTMIQAGHRVLVHCAAGMSRSATVVIGYLIKYHNMSLRDAYEYLKQCRPLIHPNNGFFAQLVAFEAQLRQTTSVQMISSPSNSNTLVPDIYTTNAKGMRWLESVTAQVTGETNAEASATPASSSQADEAQSNTEEALSADQPSAD